MPKDQRGNTCRQLIVPWQYHHKNTHTCPHTHKQVPSHLLVSITQMINCQTQTHSVGQLETLLKYRNTVNFNVLMSKERHNDTQINILHTKQMAKSETTRSWKERIQSSIFRKLVTASQLCALLKAKLREALLHFNLQSQFFSHKPHNLITDFLQKKK